MTVPERVCRMNRPGTFQKGNKAAVGHVGRSPARPNILTDILLQQLHEVDKNTGREKKHLLVERMIAMAMGEVVVLERDVGKFKKGTRVFIAPPDGRMMKEIWDRTQGKAPVQIKFGDEDGETGILQVSVIEHC